MGAAVGEQLGRWSNAPLGFVLAAINIGVVLLNEKHTRVLQDGLADHFPELRQSVETTMALAVGASPGANMQSAPLWEFVSESQGIGVLFRPATIVLQATEYDDYPRFRRVLEAVLTTFVKAVPSAIALRAGLRYVDVIVPSGDRTPDDYVQPSMHGPQLATLAGIDTQCRCQVVRRLSDQAALRVTYTRQTNNKGNFPLPEDLSLHGLTPSPVLLTCLDHQGQVGVLDFDRWEQFRERLSVETMLSRFDRLHADQSGAIRKVATELALSEWGANNA